LTVAGHVNASIAAVDMRQPFTGVDQFRCSVANWSPSSRYCDGKNNNSAADLIVEPELNEFVPVKHVCGCEIRLERSFRHRSKVPWTGSVGPPLRRIGDDTMLDEPGYEVRTGNAAPAENESLIGRRRHSVPCFNPRQPLNSSFRNRARQELRVHGFDAIVKPGR
jgi:hypothetical protein